MSNLVIRDARPEDRETVQLVTLAAYQEYAASMGPVWDLYRQNIVATLLDIGPAEQVVAEDAGALVGAVLLYPAGHRYAGTGDMPPLASPEIRLLAVEPSARGRGVGAALMQECLRRASRSGSPTITLHTSDLMQTAMRMYGRLGFQRAPELDFHPAKGVTIKGFRLSLAGAQPGS